MMKKVLCGSMALAMAISAAGCSGNSAKKGKTEDGKTLLTVFGWPDKDVNPELYESEEARRKVFMEMYPDIAVEGDSWQFSSVLIL